MTDERPADRADEASEEPAVAPGGGRKPVPLRAKVLLGLLALMGVIFAANAAHIHALEKELWAIADTKESEWTRDNADGRTVETASIVTATKEYLVYGKVVGKIEVFVKGGQEETLIGIDYFLSRDNGEWLETESGMCTAEECQIRGGKAFAEK